MTTNIQEIVKIASINHVSNYERPYDPNTLYVWHNPIMHGFNDIYQSLNRRVYDLKDVETLFEFYQNLCVAETKKLVEEV